ncbi:MAG TPA: helix-turn-helix domain-containing protein [Stackebrandtia sp.]|jgi:predicted site-specific integrase-resolvase|uniref:helix-turn-helix domain-containing protein n=1 Tax=Stackebrandtia sp. TaxID=2023065 RepID=UPI002D6D2C0A|nr:helix-turn-helix domain-containing protein [Stackebrandtia sp.]HZE41265.1 helix-turn-helix domain-containing protein [Stackebrandtia sp.]
MSRAKWLTVADILTDLKVPRRTWQEWRDKGATPPCKRLPNGQLRISERSYEKWLESLEEVNA